MKTKYLDAEIERLNLLERNEELTDWGKEMLSELKEIKQALFIPHVVMIEYLDRYSDTDLPDDKGRWARLAVYKNIRIAWISRLEVKGKAVFSVFCHFPTMQNDTANEHKVCYSFDEAKDFVNERWNWFLNVVS